MNCEYEAPEFYKVEGDFDCITNELIGIAEKLGGTVDTNADDVACEALEQIKEYIGGGTPQGILVGIVTNGGSFPTTRPDGSALQNEDYVKPNTSSTYPFTIDGITFNSSKDKAYYVGGQWFLDAGVLQDTDETPLSKPDEESFDTLRTNQYQVNKDTVYQLKNAIIEYANLNDVPADKIYKRIYRQTADTTDRVAGLYWYNATSTQTDKWEKLGGDIKAGNTLPSGKYDGELFILMKDIEQAPNNVKKGLYRFNGSLWELIATSYSAVRINAEAGTLSEEDYNKLRLRQDNIIIDSDGSVYRYSDENSANIIYQGTKKYITITKADKTYKTDNVAEIFTAPTKTVTVKGESYVVPDIESEYNNISDAVSKNKNVLVYSDNSYYKINGLYDTESKLILNYKDIGVLSYKADGTIELMNWRDKLSQKQLTINAEDKIVDNTGTVLTPTDLLELFNDKTEWVFLSHKNIVMLPETPSTIGGKFKFTGSFVLDDYVYTAEVSVDTDGTATYLQIQHEKVENKVETILEWKEDREEYDHPDEIYTTADGVWELADELHQVIDIGSYQYIFDNYTLPAIPKDKLVTAYDKHKDGKNVLLKWTILGTEKYLTILSADKIGTMYSLDVLIRNKYHCSYTWSTGTSGNVNPEVISGDIKTFIFKGYVGLTEPTSTIKEGEFWYQSYEMPTTFPIQVKRYDGASWSSTTESYTPTTLEMWADLENEHGYYWFGNDWNLIDVDVEFDDITIDKNNAGQLEIKEKGVEYKHLKEDLLVTEITEDNTDEEIPTAKAVYDEINDAPKTDNLEISETDGLKITFKDKKGNEITGLTAELDINAIKSALGLYISPTDYGDTTEETINSVTDILENQEEPPNDWIWDNGEL